MNSFIHAEINFKGKYHTTASPGFLSNKIIIGHFPTSFDSPALSLETFATGDGSTKMFYLPERNYGNIQSVSVGVNTVLPEEYAIDYQQGKITFKDAPGAGQAIKFYRYPPGTDIFYSVQETVLGAWPSTNVHGAVRIEHGSGFSFTQDADVSSNIMQKDISATDLNNDGYDDVVSCGNEGIAYQLRFGASGVVNTELDYDCASLAMGDMDQDGDQDIVAAKATTGEVKIYRNNGGGTSWTLMETIASIAATISDIKILDNNTNGDPDIFVVREGWQQTLYLNWGRSIFIGWAEDMPGGQYGISRGRGTTSVPGQTSFLSSTPNGIAFDDTYLYVSTGSYIERHDIKTFALVDINSMGATVADVDADGTYLYVALSGNVKLLDKTDYSLLDTVAITDTHSLAKAGYSNWFYSGTTKGASSKIRKSDYSMGSWNTTERTIGHDVSGMEFDGNYLYYVSTATHKLYKVDDPYISASAPAVLEIGGLGSGNDQFDQPTDIAIAGNYLYITDSNNQRVVVRRKTDLSYVKEITLSGTRVPISVAVHPFPPFNNALDFGSFHPAKAALTADIKGNGVDDWITINAVDGTPSKKTLVNFNGGGGWLGPEDHYGTSGDVGDLDGDGDLDLVLTQAYGGGPYQSPIMVFENDGTGQLTLVWDADSDTSLGFPSSFASKDVKLVDFNGDGKLDIAATFEGNDSNGIWQDGVVVYQNGPASTGTRVTEVTSTYTHGDYATTVVATYRIKPDGKVGDLISYEVKN